MPFLLKATVSNKTVPIDDRLPMLEGILHRLSKIHAQDAQWMENTVNSYVTISMEFLKLQALLEKNGSYLYKSEEEVLSAVYNNGSIFGDYYLPGLLLSQALWPNHYLIANNFSHSFLTKISPGSVILEIGVGTGFHLHEIIKSTISGIKYLGFDISELAIEYCKRFALAPSACFNASFDLGSVSNGISYANDHFDHVIMGEVLEHINNPASALKEVHRVIKPGGFFFMTTVVYAANIDHVYLFHTVDEIRSMCHSCEWKIESDWVYPIYPHDNPSMRDRPMNVAMLLIK